MPGWRNQPHHIASVAWQTLALGEHYGPPSAIGIYPGQPEIWIEGDCGRQNIPLDHLNDVIKQLRRAGKIAAENAAEETMMDAPTKTTL